MHNTYSPAPCGAVLMEGIKMTICNSSNKNGSCGVSFCFDSHTLETWFETYIAIYSRDNGEKIINGFYKKYSFRTLKAARGKIEFLTEKYNIR